MMPPTQKLRVEYLKRCRQVLRLTQTEMAKELGLTPRSYQSLEGSKARIGRRTILAIDRVALRMASDRKNPLLAPPSVRSDAAILGELSKSTVTLYLDEGAIKLSTIEEAQEKADALIKSGRTVKFLAFDATGHTLSGDDLLALQTTD